MQQTKVKINIAKRLRFFAFWRLPAIASRSGEAGGSQQKAKIKISSAPLW
jgi:hypothetical protein